MFAAWGWFLGRRSHNYYDCHYCDILIYVAVWQYVHIKVVAPQLAPAWMEQTEEMSARFSISKLASENFLFQLIHQYIANWCTGPINRYSKTQNCCSSNCLYTVSYCDNGRSALRTRRYTSTACVQRLYEGPSIHKPWKTLSREEESNLGSTAQNFNKIHFLSPLRTPTLGQPSGCLAQSLSGNHSSSASPATATSSLGILLDSGCMCSVTNVQSIFSL